MEAIDNKPPSAAVLRRIFWEIKYWQRNIQRYMPWPMIAGIVALALAIGLTLSGWRDLQRNTLLEQQLVAWSVQQPSHNARPTGSDDERLAMFYALLPAASSIPSIIETLITQAAAEELILQAGEYRAEQHAAGGFMEYRIALPVRGDAAALQTFLLKALRTQRVLALESVTFKRERIESRQVDARIRLVLFTKPVEETSRKQP